MPDSAPLYRRRLPDGRRLTVETYACGLGLTIGSAALIEDMWLYTDRDSALQAAHQWDGTSGEPEGWSVHPPSGRQRPEGDPAREYVGVP